ncbi:STAS domain-containing protein [Mycobacterium simiae]|uniref:STAS domain-containing protein n=1 Tax=Mycobacterium simiae TaxID=1784 RepID=UPI0026226927|nr:STAS domain-containing protein [Mycobacterium simiae]
MNRTSVTVPAASGSTAPRTYNVIDCAGASITVRRRPSAAVLAVDGEVDATNVVLFSAAIRRFAAVGRPVVLDLSGLGFLNLTGFRSLLTLHRDYRRTDSPFMVVPGAALHPLLRAIPDHGLILQPSAAEAMDRISEMPHANRPIFHLVIGSGRGLVGT